MPKRVFAAVFVAALALATQGRAEEWSKTFTVTGKPDLRVETNDASVRIEAWDRQEIEARVISTGYRLALAGSGEEGGVRVHQQQSGDRVELNVHVPTMHWIIGINSRSVRIELKAPRDGSFDIRTRDGSIGAAGVRGDVRLSSGDGHIEADQLEGALHAKSGDGHMRIRGRFEELSLETGDGRIDAEVSHGSRIATVWTLHTGDGSVKLRLPDDFAADLEAHTGDGRVRVDFPVTISGTISKSDVRGKLNGGGPPLRILTGDGSILVERL
jgi:DUF4097 and DUF4098 domain-containing protein YvlB